MLNLQIQGRDLRLGEQFHEKATQKLSKYSKYFVEDVEAHVKVKKEANLFGVEITLKAKKYLMRSEAKAEDLMLALENATDRLETQLQKQKTKLLKKHKSFMNETAFMEESSLVEEPKIVKNKKFRLETLDDEEAMLQLELLGHDFLLYRDVDTGAVALLYRRKDGQYGKIDELQ